MAEQVTKGILATFGVYETDIHDLDATADELERAYAKSRWMKDERARFAAMVRGLKARGRAALRADSDDEPLEPPEDTIERLGAAYDLLLRWLGLVARLHPEARDDVKGMARSVAKLERERLGIEDRRERAAAFRKLPDHVRRAVSQAKELAGE